MRASEKGVNVSGSFTFNHFLTTFRHSCSLLDPFSSRHCMSIFTSLQDHKQPIWRLKLRLNHIRIGCKCSNLFPFTENKYWRYKTKKMLLSSINFANGFMSPNYTSFPVHLIVWLFINIISTRFTVSLRIRSTWLNGNSW
jgi:hypothetical protein